MFGLCGLWREAIVYWSNAIKIAERIGDLDTVAQSYQCMSSFGWTFSGDLPNFEYNMRTHALTLCLKALGFSKKTDSLSTQCKIYATLACINACFDNVKDAEENYRKITAMPSQILSHPEIVSFVTIAEAALQTMKGHWKEAYKKVEEALVHSKKTYVNCLGLELDYRRIRAWLLTKQERIEEAQNELHEVDKLQSEIDEKFAHTNLEADLMAHRNVSVGEECEMRFDLMNISRKPGSLTRIENTIPVGFKIIDLPPFCTRQDSNIELKGKSVEPFEVETIKIKLKTTQPGSYTLNPSISYVNDLGENKTCSPNPIVIDTKLAQPKFEIMPGRIATGYAELDRLLLGGMPEKYAVLLTAPSSDEREQLIRRFLKSGFETEQTVLYLTCEAGKLQDMLKYPQTSFYVLVCGAQADTLAQDSTNLFKLKGIDSLTEIGIVLTKIFRTLRASEKLPRRACIDLISDVLLQHHAVITRKWLNELLLSMKLNGFTTFAVVDPQMHPDEEVQAILSLFDGEIRISEKQNANGIMERVMKIRRLYNQKYLEEESALTKEMLEQ